MDPIGLIPAVRASLDEVGREAGWAVNLTQNLEEARLPAVVETSAYRIVQEALANALKHARTARVDVDFKKDGDTLFITVADWGVGFRSTSGETPGSGLGLLSMRERARLLGGDCVIESEPERGTRVRVRLPLGAGATGGS